MSTAETVRCGSCNAEVPETSAFCPRCGAAQAADAKGQDASSMPGDLQAFGSRLAAVAKAPTVMPVLLAAVVGALFTLVAGLGSALLVSDNSYLAVGDSGDDLFTRVVAQSMSVLQAGFVPDVGTDEYFVRNAPLLLALAPVLACAIGGFVAARAIGPRAHTNWLVVPAALLFAALMAVLGALTPAAAFDDVTFELSVGSAFLMSFIWGCLGFGLGFSSARRDQTGEADEGVEKSGVLRGVGRSAQSVLLPLMILLLVFGVLGTGLRLTQTFRGVEGLRDATGAEERDTAGVAVEDALFFADNALHFTELAAGVQFYASPYGAYGMPLPVQSVGEVTDTPEAIFRDGTDAEEIFNADGRYRSFDYRDALPVWAFIPLMALIVLPALGALFAGFRLARERGARSPQLGAAWGLIVGPVWALSMVLLNALVQKDIYGKAAGDSVFVIFLLGGAVLGALGGALASSSSGTGVAQSGADLSPAR